MISVYIPTPFRSFVGNRTSVEVEGSDVAEVISNLDARFPGFRNLCYDSRGAIPTHINIYVNNTEINALEGEQTKLASGDQVAVIPALAGGALFRRQCAARAGISRRLARGELPFARNAQLRLCTKAGIGQARGIQARQPFFVDGPTLLLAIHRVRAAHVRPLVPIDAQPVQVGEQGAHEILVGARLVGILDTQYESPAGLARGQVVQQRGAGVPEVQEPGRAGGETCNQRL